MLLIVYFYRKKAIEPEIPHIIEDEKVDNSPAMRIIRIVLGVILSIFLVFFMLTFILLIPRVQNFIVNKTTTYLSKEWGTKVSIDELVLDPIKQLQIKGLIIYDKRNDTLLYAGRTYVGFSKNIFELFSNKFSIKKIELDNAVIHTKRHNLQEGYNYQFLIDYFGGNDTVPSKSDFRLDVKNLKIKNTKFSQNDFVQGNQLKMEFPNGVVNLDQLDLIRNSFAIKDIILEDPFISIEKNFPKSALEAIADREKSETNTVKAPKEPLDMSIDIVKIKNGRFMLHNWRRTPKRTIGADYFDYDHLDIGDINLSLECIQSKDLDFVGKINQIQAKADNGFALEEFNAQEAKISSRRTELNGVYVKTQKSIMQDTIIFKYLGFDSFHDFNDKVIMEGKLKNSNIKVEDIITFAYKLDQNSFFKRIRSENLKIDGRIQGKVNSLRADDLQVSLGNLVSIKGNFSTKNLAIPQEEMLNLGFDELKTSMTNLRKILPNFNPPPNFDKLGNIHFKGRYDGFISDFVAFGELKTSQGLIDLDMQLNTNEGKENAKYRGKMVLKQFDLAHWTDDNRFGKLNMVTEVKEGKGLTLASLKSKLDANVFNFEYNGYNYKNIIFKGELNKNLINGDASIKDENIDLRFSGVIDYIKTIPEYKFKANINKLDLHKLNLTKDSLSIAGEFGLDFKFKNLSNFTGNAKANNVELKVNDSNKFTLKSFELNSYVNNTNHKHIDIKSDVFQGNIDGQFEFESLPYLVYHFIKKNNPTLLAKTKIKQPKYALYNNNFKAKIHVEQSKNLFEVLKWDLKEIKDLKAVMSFENTDTSRINFNLEKIQIPKLEFGKNMLENIESNLLVDNQNLIARVTIDNTHIDKNIIGPTTLQLKAYNDSLIANFETGHIDSLFRSIHFNATTFIFEDDFMTKFVDSRFNLLDSIWRLKDQNFVRYNKDKIYTRNFDFYNAQSHLSVNSIGDKGLALFIKDLDLSKLNGYFKSNNVWLNGNSNLTISVQDVFSLKGLEAKIYTDSLRINDTNCGHLSTFASTPDLDHPIDIHMLLRSEASYVKVDGYYQYKTKAKAEEINLKAFTQKLSLPILLKFIIKDGISEVEGGVDSELSLTGTFKKLALNGVATLRKGGVKVNYLNTKYYFEDQKVQITPYYFDFSGDQFTDKDGRKANIQGKILHDHFKSFKLDLNINSDGLLVLDTDKKSNPLYYGKVIAQTSVEFKGDFSNTDINIVGTSKKGTKVILPLGQSEGNRELKFLRFTKKDSSALAESTFKKIQGLDVELNLTVNDDAEINLIFDEITDDIIRATGYGNLVVKIPRKGEFNINGQYNIENGDYNYTVPIPNFSLVKQPFKLRKGSTISWTGDPLEALIQINAESKNIRTSVYPFIEEYVLNNPALEGQSKSLTNVDLILKLQGELLKPDINFSIEFPNLQSNIKTLVETKLLALSNDPNELNKQALSLLITRSFLPSNSLDFNFDRTAINTLSNLVSFYLSKILSQYVATYSESNNIISGIDINVGLAYNDVLTSNSTLNFAKNGEFSFNPKFHLFQDKVVLDLGANIKRNAADDGANYFATDVALEYFLKPNKELVLRVFVQGDRYLTNRMTRMGGGITYRKEYESFYHFMKGNKIQ